MNLPEGGSDLEHVSVIGLGVMGSALAHCLLENGYQVTVWNRSPEKCTQLVAAGAQAARTAEQAVAASPISLVCIKGHLETLELLSDFPALLQDKTICDLSTGNTEQAETLVDFLQSNGAAFMIGAINSLPSGIGDEASTILVAAEDHTWARYRELITVLAGRSTHVSTQPTDIAKLFAALFTTRQGFLFGMVYGAIICQKAGIPLQVFSDQIPVAMKVMDSYYKLFAETVPQGDFDNPSQASVETLSDALDDTLAIFQSCGAPTGLPQFMCDKVHSALEAGLGDKEMTVLTKHLLG